MVAKIISPLFINSPKEMMKALVYTEDSKRYSQKLSRIINITTASSYVILRRFKESELVEFDNKGRMIYVNLTPKGRIIANAIIRIDDNLKK